MTIISTRGLGELSSQPARRLPDHGIREHEWDGDRCRWCSMLTSWEGARYGCPVPAQRCAHVSPSGVRCKRRIEPSRDMCAQHGGKR